MKCLISFFFGISLIGCSATEVIDYTSPNIQFQHSSSTQEIPEIIYYTEIENTLEALNDYQAAIEEAPFIEEYLWCGGVYAPEESLEEIFESSSTGVVIHFQGVHERWVPIEGKPKKYYVFTIQ